MKNRKGDRDPETQIIRNAVRLSAKDWQGAPILVLVGADQDYGFMTSVSGPRPVIEKAMWSAIDVIGRQGNSDYVREMKRTLRRATRSALGPAPNGVSASASRAGKTKRARTAK